MDLSSSETQPLAERLGENLSQRGWTITAAESCTGGLLAGALTAIPGSSAWFHGSAITYANRIKTALVGVSPAVLETHGAVSQDTVEAMAHGAARVFEAEVAIAISGIAGPDGAVPGKPVGTVWIAVATPNNTIIAREYHFEGDRQAVRAQAVISALRATLNVFEKPL